MRCAVGRMQGSYYNKSRTFGLPCYEFSQNANKRAFCRLWRYRKFGRALAVYHRTGEAMRGIASIYLLCRQSKFDMRFALDMHTLRCVDMPCEQGVIFARRVRFALCTHLHRRAGVYSRRARFAHSSRRVRKALCTGLCRHALEIASFFVKNY